MSMPDMPVKPSRFNAMKSSRWSINKCLFILGADWAFKYPKGSQQRKPISIYDRIDIDMLAVELKQLYRQAIKKNHPDVHSPDMKPFYTQRLQLINLAYNKGKNILEHRGVKV